MNARATPPWNSERLSLKVTWVVGLLAAMLVSLVFTLIVFNRSLPVEDGWFQIVADRMSRGQVPYRDFYLFLQPGYPLLVDGLVDLFGHVFIVLRALGVLERVLLTTALYLLYSRIGRPWAASAAAVVTVMTFASFTADGVESYLQLCTALALFGVFFAGQALETPRARRAIALAATAGALLGLAFFVKQTTGLLITVAVVVVSAFVLFRRGDRRQWMRIFALVGGFLIVAAAFVLWLLASSAWHGYVQQVWLGSTSKGSLLNVAFGFLSHSLPSTWFLGLVILLTIGAPWIYLARRSTAEEVQQPGQTRRETIAAAAVGGMLLLSVVVPLAKRDSLVSFATTIDYFNTKRMIVSWAFLGAAVVTLFVALEIESKGLSTRRIWMVLLAAVSAAAAWATSMSFAIDEAAALPCLGFFIVLALDAPAPRQLVWLKNAVLLGLCCLAVMMAAGARYATPYYWWGWLEPDIASATHRLPYAAAAGLRVSPATATAYRTIMRDIDRYAPHRDGSVYAFPHMGVFYVLSGRYPTTHAVVDYWDVCPDDVARRDAAHLLEHPPEVIVWMVFAEEVWMFHEDGFRGGRRSGQRAIRAAVEKMVANGTYELVDTVTVTGCYPIEVYVRTDAMTQ